MIPYTNPQALETRLNELKNTVRGSMNKSIKKIKEQAQFDELSTRSLPVSALGWILLKFYNGLSGMMPLKSVGPFF